MQAIARDDREDHSKESEATQLNHVLGGGM